MKRFLLLMLLLCSCATGSRYPHERDCRERIDDCMEDCPHDPNMEDACFASCRNQSCDTPPPEH